MRGSEDLELVKDGQVRDADIEYISQHNITQLMRETMEALLIHRPKAPVPFMIDCFSMGPRLASQDARFGISVWRKEELLRVFSFIEQVSILQKAPSDHQLTEASSADVQHGYNTAGAGHRGPSCSEGICQQGWGKQHVG